MRRINGHYIPSTSTKADTRSSMSGDPPQHPQKTTMAVFTGVGVVFDFHDVFVGYRDLPIYNWWLWPANFSMVKLPGFFSHLAANALGSGDQFSRVIISLLQVCQIGFKTKITAGKDSHKCIFSDGRWRECPPILWIFIRWWASLTNDSWME